MSVSISTVVAMARRGELQAEALEDLFNALWHSLDQLPWAIHGLPHHQQTRQALVDLETPLLALLDHLASHTTTTNRATATPPIADTNARLRAEDARERARDINQSG